MNYSWLDLYHGEKEELGRILAHVYNFNIQILLTMYYTSSHGRISFHYNYKDNPGFGPWIIVSERPINLIISAIQERKPGIN